MKLIDKLECAQQIIAQGKILAYPTEAVYGLGCDPFNEQAVMQLLRLKHRAVEQGLILLIADWRQLAPLIQPVSDALLTPVRATWPGSVTWLFPKSAFIPAWISGQHNSIAIRMTAHPLAKQLCAQQPLVSTSANISGQSPALTISELDHQFPMGIDGVMQGELGGLDKPSAIFDVLTGVQLR